MSERTIVIRGVRYYESRPKNCKGCFFWKNKRKGCSLGEENCYYLAEAPHPESPCKHCCYGPCISFCMRKVLGQKEVPQNA